MFSLMMATTSRGVNQVHCCGDGSLLLLRFSHWFSFKQSLLYWLSFSTSFAAEWQKCRHRKRRFRLRSRDTEVSRNSPPFSPKDVFVALHGRDKRRWSFLSQPGWPSLDQLSEAFSWSHSLLEVLAVRCPPIELWTVQVPTKDEFLKCGMEG